MIKTKVLIIGATALGISLAEQLEDDVLVIDEGINAGGEFTDALGGDKCETKELSGNTLSLINEISERNLINENGEIHLIPVSNILAKRILDRKIKILLMTSVISVTKEEKGYKLAVVSNDFSEEIYAETIVNTMYTHKYSENGFSKEISALLIDSEDIKEKEETAYRIIKSRFLDESYLFINADDCKDIIEAREKLHNFWRENRAKFGKSKIANTGSRFYYRFKENVKPFITEGGIIYAPSVSYGNIAAAFEGGKDVLQILKR